MSKEKREVPANLKPYCWPKGVSGNPSGRTSKPKPLTLSEAHKRQLSEIDSETGKTFAEIVAARIVSCAATGDVAAIMQALSLDSENLIRQAIDQIAEQEGVSKAQARAALSLFVPTWVEV